MDLVKLKEAVSRLKTIDDKTKGLIENATADNVQTEVTPMNKDKVFSLYGMRYELLKEKSRHNPNWVNLLNTLTPVEDHLPIIITYLLINDKGYVVFSDSNFDECFGIIYNE